MLLLEMSQLQLLLAKSKLVFDMAERERTHYDFEKQQIEDHILESQAELDELEQDLVEARKIRANKIEYDELAVEVLRYPSRESSQQSIDNLNQEIKELREDGENQVKKMGVRREQFLTALKTLQSIQESIAEDEREEAKRLFLKRTQVDDDDDDDDDLIGDGFGVEGIAGFVTAAADSNTIVGTSQDDGTTASNLHPLNGRHLLESEHRLSRSSSVGSFSESQQLTHGVGLEVDQTSSHERRSTNGSFVDSPNSSQGGGGEGVSIDGVFSTADTAEDSATQPPIRHGMDRHGDGQGSPETPASSSMTATPTIPGSPMNVDP
ncbi:THO complex subunit 7 [Podila humilis]|nr:THO complex subunit 7 [Podila humilis]